MIEKQGSMAVDIVLGAGSVMVNSDDMYLNTVCDGPGHHPTGHVIFEDQSHPKQLIYQKLGTTSVLQSFGPFNILPVSLHLRLSTV